MSLFDQLDILQRGSALSEEEVREIVREELGAMAAEIEDDARSRRMR